MKCYISQPGTRNPQLETPKVWKRIRHTSLYLFVRMLVRTVERLSRRSALLVGERLGRAAYRSVRGERRKVRAGLKVAFGTVWDDRTIERLTRQVFVDLGKNVADTIWFGRAREIERVVRAEGLEHFDRALARGRGAILLTGHIGNWELLAAYFVAAGYPVSAVGRPLRDPRLDRLLVESRRRSGLRNIARGTQTREILRSLRENRIVVLLIDQDTKVNGVFVDVFGRPAYTPVGPVVLAMRTGATIVPAAIHRESDDTHHVVVKPEIELIRTGDAKRDVQVNTQRCSKVLEEYIREHPSQWVWMHERWKSMDAETRR